MADTVNVPGIKKPLPKWAVIGGLATVGVLIVMHYRNGGSGGGFLGLFGGGSSSTPSTAPAGVPAAGTDPFPWDGTYNDPTDPFSMDTTTGQTYGDEGAAGNNTGNPGGAGGGGGGSGPPFSNNQAWSAYVIGQLPQDQGLAEAVGLYLSGAQLDSSQANLVYAAIGVGGDPPVPGTGNYPPKLRIAKSKGPTFADNPVSGLEQQSNSQTAVTISWKASKAATGYKVALDGKPAVTVHGTSHTIRGLKANSSYKASVLAVPAEKGASPATVQIRTAVTGTGTTGRKGK